MAISHTKVSAKADGGDATLVLPSDWNATHTIDAATITLAQLANISATQRVIGRNTAGAGVPEAVTASQLFDWVSSTNGVILTRTGGTWAAAANVKTDNGDLSLAVNAAPIAPAAGHVKVLAADIGGRSMLRQLGPSGVSVILQPHFGRTRIATWTPANATNAISTVGLPAATAIGTVSNRSVATTGLGVSMRRVGHVSSSTAGTLAGIRGVSTTGLWRGNAAGLGGFHVVMRFMISDTAIVAGRTFVGIHESFAAPTNVDPSIRTNIVGVGQDAGDTELQLYAAGAVAQARVSLGVNFPINTTNTDAYELVLFAAPNASQITYEVTRLNTGDVASGTISAAANLPVSTALMGPVLWRTNNATAAVVGIDMIGVYVEVDQ